MTRPLILALILLPLCSLVCTGDDWADFRGPTRNGHSAETKLLTKWPEAGPKLLWSAKGLGQGYSSASIAKGKVYISGRIERIGYLFCFDLQGKQLWKSRYGPETDGWRFPGSRSSATINDGRAYLLSGLGQLVCFDAVSGKVVWQQNILQKFNARNIRFGLAESLLVDGDNVICTPGGPGASVVALNKKTGKLVWKCAGLSDPAAYCSPRLIIRGKTRLLTTCTDSNIVGIDADSGKLLWKYAYRNQYGIHPNTPVLDGDHLFVTSGYGYGYVILKLAEDGKSVTKVKRARSFDTHHGGVVRIGKYVYGTSDKRPRGNWMCLEIQTGQEIYRAAGIGKGSVVTANGLLYCYDERNGTVALAKADPKGFSLISKFTVDYGEREHWAHPAISDGRLYIRHGSVMKVYDISAK